MTGRASSEDGMFQRNMLPIHGGQEIKPSLFLHLFSLPSPSFSTLNSAACLFTSFSVSSPQYVCFFPSPIIMAFGYSFLFIFLQFKSIHFFFTFMLGELAQHGGVAPLRLVVAECSPACHLGTEMEIKNITCFTT